MHPYEYIQMNLALNMDIIVEQCYENGVVDIQNMFSYVLCLNSDQCGMQKKNTHSLTHSLTQSLICQSQKLDLDTTLARYNWAKSQQTTKRTIMIVVLIIYRS